jgi:hypothetical protein
MNCKVCKDLEGGSYGLFQDTILAFTCRHYEKSWEPSVRINYF